MNGPAIHVNLAIMKQTF